MSEQKKTETTETETTAKEATKEATAQRVGAFTGKYAGVCDNTYSLLGVVFGMEAGLRDWVCRQYASDLGRAKFKADGTSVKLSLTAKDGQRALSHGQKGSVPDSLSIKLVAIAQGLHTLAQKAKLRPHVDAMGNTIGLFPLENESVRLPLEVEEWLERHERRLKALTAGAITREQLEAERIDDNGAAPPDGSESREGEGDEGESEAGE